MAPVMARDLLTNEVATLPESIAAEVLDFVLFMKARHAEDAFLWQQVETARTRRRQHPEEVITVTAEEWDAVTANLVNTD